MTEIGFVESALRLNPSPKGSLPTTFIPTPILATLVALAVHWQCFYKEVHTHLNFVRILLPIVVIKLTTKPRSILFIYAQKGALFVPYAESMPLRISSTQILMFVGLFISL